MSTDSDKPNQSGSESRTSFSLADIPALDMLLEPVDHGAVINSKKVRRLYVQAAMQQWFAPKKLNFESPVEMDSEERRVWTRLMYIFYTLEKMGLNTIAFMLPKATRKLKSDDAQMYLSAQIFDEARHVFSIESYLRRLGQSPHYDWKYHVLGQIAGMGAYRVENWLFSTLFSENFASAFLRRSKIALTDPMGAEMCKNLLLDESRHLHFLHTVLPDLLDRLSVFGRTYLKASQFFLMKFTEQFSHAVTDDAKLVGIDRIGLIEEVFENVERAYESFGVSRDFLYFPKITPNRMRGVRVMTA